MEASSSESWSEMGDIGRDGGCGDYAARTHAARLWLVLGESVREREIGVDLTLVTGSVEAWI